MTRTASTTAPIGASVPAPRFSVAIDGDEIAAFSKMSGMHRGRTPSGQARAPMFTLKESIKVTPHLLAWHEAVLRGGPAVAGKRCTLTAFSNGGQPGAKFSLRDAWPSQIVIAGFTHGSNAALVEEVTFTCRSFRRVSV
jgi:hypothetical protein